MLSRSRDRFPGPLRGLEFDAATGRSKRASWGGGYRATASLLLQRYKFRLVIANSLCEDYVTEPVPKNSRSLQVGPCKVVMVSTPGPRER